MIGHIIDKLFGFLTFNMTTLCEYAAKNYKTCVRVSKWMVPRVSGTPWCPAYTGNHHFWPKTYYKALALLKFDFLTLVWPQAWRTLLNHGNNWKLCLPNNCYSVFRAKIAMSQSVCLIYGNTHIQMKWPWQTNLPNNAKHVYLGNCSHALKGHVMIFDPI